MRRTILFSCVTLLPIYLPSGAAQAQQPAHPAFMPTRDVSVVYDVQPDSAPGPQRITVLFSGGGRLMRVDSPDGQGSTILDRDQKLMTVLINSQKLYMQIPEREAVRSPFLLDPSMKFAAAGTDTVAGVACAKWTILGPAGDAAACVTDDGVVLSMVGADPQGERGHLQAQQVNYGPLPATAFQVPADFNRVAHPEGPDAYQRGQSGPSLGPAGQ